jgi:hypothetical protein
MLSDSAFVLQNLIFAVGMNGLCCNCDKRSPCGTNLWFPDLFHATRVYENNVDTFTVIASADHESQPQIQKNIPIDFTYYFCAWFLVISKILCNLRSRPTFKLLCALAFSGEQF